MIYRTFYCLNTHCRHQFTVTDDEAPPCPRCAGARTQWIPGTTGVISGKTQNIDATVKEMRAPHGDKNWRSATRAGERAAPYINPEPVGKYRHRFAPGSNPGWGIDLPTTKDGKVIERARCAPTGVTIRAPVTIGGKVAASSASPTSTGMVPRYEAMHRGRLP